MHEVALHLPERTRIVYNIYMIHRRKNFSSAGSPVMYQYTILCLCAEIERDHNPVSRVLNRDLGLKCSYLTELVLHSFWP